MTQGNCQENYKCKPVCYDTREVQTCMLWHKKTVKKSCKCKPVCYEARNESNKKIISAKPVCYDTRELWRKLQLQTYMLWHNGTVKKTTTPNLYAMTQERLYQNDKSKLVRYDTRKASKKKNYNSKPVLKGRKERNAPFFGFWDTCACILKYHLKQVTCKFLEFGHSFLLELKPSKLVIVGLRVRVRVTFSKYKPVRYDTKEVWKKIRVQTCMLWHKERVKKR